jgi:hypothetical protein
LIIWGENEPLFIKPTWVLNSIMTF